MNKSAVAMAADSAVTISSGRGSIKTYDTANKLFELVRGCPVGIMIYANAEMNGIPWETLIKAYRQRHAECRYSSLEEYEASFLQFLSDPMNPLLSTRSEQKAFEITAYEAFLQVISHVNGGIADCITSSGRLVKARALELVRQSIEKVRMIVDSYDDAPWRTAMEDAGYDTAYRPIAERMAAEVFADVDLLVRDRRTLAELALLTCVKDVRLNLESGLVVAGFGEDDPFPSCRSLTLRGRMAGVLRATGPEVSAIGFDDGEGGFVDTFAQNEMANQYLFGINERTKDRVIQYWQRWIEQCHPYLVAVVRNTQPRLSAPTSERIADGQQQLISNAFAEFLDYMNRHLYEDFVEPLLQSVSLLPKDELALVAESLVNLASLRQRMMIDQLQTVGGEIDVALISRGDGLVWIKRKHYFSLDLNPTWTYTHRPAPLWSP